MSTTAYDTITATSYIRAFAYKERLTLNVTQCQKILYIIYGYCLAKYDRVVFLESPKAWPFGPVFPISQKKGDYVNLKYAPI